MYPIVRLGLTSLRAALSRRIGIDSVCKTTFRCMPWDLDIFFEMNNGRILTLYDLGRFDLTVRSGLFKRLIRKRWAVVVAGGAVRYRKRIRIFDKVTILTHVAGFEGRWIYIVQSMWVKGRPVSSVLFRTGVTHMGKTVSVDEVLKEAGISGWKTSLPDWVTSWINCEQDRPWPPQPDIGTD